MGAAASAPPNTLSTRMPAPLHVFSLGPIPVGDDVATIFVGSHEGRLLSSRFHDAESALHELRAMAPLGVPLVCSPELAVVGARHGFRNLPLPEDVRRHRANLAFGLAHVDLAPPPSAPVEELLEAATAFWAARPWERLPADTALAVTFTGELQATYEAVVMGASDEAFGVALYPKAGSVARRLRAAESGRIASAANIDSLSVTFDTAPRFAADAVAAAYGCPRVPLAFWLKRGKARAIDASDTLTLASVLKTLTTMEGRPGEEGVGALHSGDRGVRATIRLPDPDAPPNKRR